MNLVVPCAGQSNCYVYTVRGGGPPPSGNGSGTTDNLPSIAKFFGVKETTIRSMNGLSSTAVVQPGDKLKIPPPTR
jgi:LysM repeat protein